MRAIGLMVFLLLAGCSGRDAPAPAPATATAAKTVNGTAMEPRTIAVLTSAADAKGLLLSPSARYAAAATAEGTEASFRIIDISTDTARDPIDGVAVAVDDDGAVVYAVASPDGWLLRRSTGFGSVRLAVQGWELVAAAGGSQKVTAVYGVPRREVDTSRNTVFPAGRLTPPETGNPPGIG